LSDFIIFILNRSFNLDRVMFDDISWSEIEWLEWYFWYEIWFLSCEWEREMRRRDTDDRKAELKGSRQQAAGSRQKA
jgi:hypothetical protein